MKTPTGIVLLSGVGSVGKSSIAKALQKITTKPFLHVEMDTFLQMLPDAYQDHPDGLRFETTIEGDKPTVFVRTGAVAERALSGMRHAVAAMAGAGNNLIVDEVIFGNVTTEYGNVLSEYRMLLAPFQLYLVGVHAPLEVLEDRERRRGDRLIGLARWQYGRVHNGMVYDLEIDIARATAAESALIIKERFGL